MPRLVNLLAGGGSSAVATQAFVLYEGGGIAYATVHPLRREGEEWHVGPGRPLGLDQLGDALRLLAGAGAGRQILPGYVLFADGSRTLWYRPSSRRPIFFHTGKKEFDDALRGKQVLFPALLFLGVPGNLYVWALASDARPGLETPLYQAPFLNIYESGHQCNGTAKLPLEIGVDVSLFEKSFFETTFTHSNVGRKLTRHPEGHDGLWRALSDPRRETFPAEWLMPLGTETKPLTVSYALNLEVRT